MSFGTSPSDVDTVVAFCRALYRKCRDAGGEYDEISHEVRGMRSVKYISLMLPCTWGTIVAEYVSAVCIHRGDLVRLNDFVTCWTVKTDEIKSYTLSSNISNTKSKLPTLQ